MKPVLFSLALAFTAATVAPRPLQAQEATRSADLTLAASTNLEPLCNAWSEAWQSKGGNKVTMQALPTAQAAAAFIEGKVAMAPLARDMTAAELQAFTTKWGYAPTRIAVAMDALVILVNKSNPIKEIKIEQVDAVWSSTRLQGWPKDILTWGELGLTAPNWASRPIQRIGRPDGSGMRAHFIEMVELGGKGKADTKRATDAMAIVEEIVSNQAAMGYGGLSELYSSLKAVPLAPRGGKTAVEATPENIASGTYPLTTVTYIYVKKAPGKSLPPDVSSFLRFVLSKEGQKCVTGVNLVSLPDDLISLNLRRIGQ